MHIVLEGRDLVRYPFLKEAKQYIGEYATSIETFLASKSGEIALKSAISMITSSLTFKKGIEANKMPDYPNNATENKIFIAAYALARILLSCSGNRSMIERFCIYQGWLFYHHIQQDIQEGREDLVQFIAHQFGMEVGSEVLPVTQYISITASVPDARWHLVNRHIVSGQVFIEKDEFYELLREKLISILNDQLPLRVPEGICSSLSPSLDDIKKVYQERMLEEFGPVDDDAFPPCISALLESMAKGGYLSHMARFTGTSFLHNIGMDPLSIIELYGHSPGFNLERTAYQVNHISGEGGSGTDYTSPMCATMKTHGLCIHANALCAKINHPLSYYKRKKTELTKKSSLLSKKEDVQEDMKENIKRK
jgi:DNA primase large subunit